MNHQEIIKSTKLFFEQNRGMVPHTIYFEDWASNMTMPNIATLSFIENVLKEKKKPLNIAEIGIGAGATTYNIAKLMNNEGQLHIFDFENSVNDIAYLLKNSGYTNIVSHGCSTKYLDSYNWNLLKLIEENQTKFDYIYIDGAHNFPTDGLTFFLCDMLLNINGYLEFDDYDWTIQAHIDANSKKYKEDPEQFFGSFIKRSKESFTEEQLKTKQVKLIVDLLVKNTHRYIEIAPNRLFKKER